MTTYCYKCLECDHTFEIVQRMVDDSLKDCPACKKPQLQKVIQPAGGFRIGGLGVHKPTAIWGDPH